jgi:hypothetical protein
MLWRRKRRRGQNQKRRPDGGAKSSGMRLYDGALGVRAARIAANSRRISSRI